MLKPRTWKFLWFCGGVLLAALWKMGKKHEEITLSARDGDRN
jgi:hypothetical protein